MKGNNKGFAITAVIYSILVIVIIIMTLVLAIISSRRQNVEKIQERVKKETSDVKSNNNSNNNGGISLNVGDEVCIGGEGGECFYVLSFDSTNYTLFAKYNLYVGRKYTSGTSYVMITTSNSRYGKQDEDAKGDKESPAIGTMAFSDTTSAISNYATYIKNAYGIIVSARPIKNTELEGIIGCKPVGAGGCSNTGYPWILNTTYWANADPTSSTKAYLVGGDGFYGSYGNTNASYRGARPVIEVSASDIVKFTKVS